MRAGLTGTCMAFPGQGDALARSTCRLRSPPRRCRIMLSGADECSNGGRARDVMDRDVVLAPAAMTFDAFLSGADPVAACATSS